MISAQALDTAQAVDTAMERQLVELPVRAFDRRAEALRKKAAAKATLVNDRFGNEVLVVPAPAIVMIRTAQIFQDCAADVAALLGPIAIDPVVVPPPESVAERIPPLRESPL